MSQTLHSIRSLNTKVGGHKHTLHVVIIDQCNADEKLEQCKLESYQQDTDDLCKELFDAVYKVLNYQEERSQ